MGKDWTGQKFHRLTFIRPTDKRVRSGIVWEAQCDCGTTVEVMASDVVKKNATHKSCGCLSRETKVNNGKMRGTSSRRYDPIISSARGVWGRTYKDIDFDTFYQLSQQSCDYCGSLPAATHNIGVSSKKCYSASELQLNEGTFTYNGLDRVDSSRGHTVDNVVPCCWECNRMKGNRTREEFLAHNTKIHVHQLTVIAGT